MSVRSVAQEATNATRPGWDGRCLTCPPLVFLSLPFCCNFPISPQILLYFFSSIQNVPVKPVKISRQNEVVNNSLNFRT